MIRAADAPTDLAVRRARSAGLPYAALGDSARRRAGQVVIAMSNPLWFESSVRTGDFVLALNGQAVQYVDDLHRGLSESPFGEPVRIELLHRTKRMVLEVVPEEIKT